MQALYSRVIETLPLIHDKFSSSLHLGHICYEGIGRAASRMWVLARGSPNDEVVCVVPPHGHLPKTTVQHVLNPP